MANQIKGLTVRIGAETTGLNKALKDVNKQSRKISRELYKVNRALKFNPDSVELWGQKQELLTDKVEKTKKKLNALKQSQEEVERKFKKGEIDDGQYRAFKREVIETENKLGYFTDQLEETKRKASEFGRKMRAAADNMEKVGNRMKNVGQKLNTNVTLPLMAAFTALTVGTRDFRKEISVLENNAISAGVSMETLDKKMAQLNAVTGELDSNVEGLSSLLAAGFKGEQMTEVVNQLSGAVSKFPDTMKFENLGESLQETIGSGESVGQFDELLSRFGINLEEFNGGLQTAKENGEELDYVLQTLAGTGLSEVYEQYRKNNEELVESAEAFYDLQSSLADLGEELEPILTDIVEGATDVVDAFNDLSEEKQDMVLFGAAVAAALGPVLSIAGNLSITISTLTNVIASAGGLTAAVSGLASKFGAFAVGGAVAGAIAYFVKGLKDAKEQIDMINKGIDGLTIAQLNEKLAALEKEKAKLNELISRGDEGLFVDTSHAEERLENINKKIKETKTQISELKEKPEPASSADEGDSGSDTGGGEGGPTELETLLSDLDKQIEDYNFEQRLSDIGITWLQEIEKIEREKKKKLITADQLGASDETLKEIEQFYVRQVGDVIENAKEKSLELEEQHEDEIAILRREGEEKELERLRQQKQAELDAAKGKEDALDEIREKYKIKRQQVRDKYDEIEKQAAEKLQNELALIRTQGKEKELEKLEQWFEDEQEKAKGNEEALTALKKLYKEKRQDIEEEYAGKEQELQDERMENKFALNQISLQQYKEYLQERLKDYEEYTDEWLKLKEKIDNLEVTPVEVESEYTEELELLKQKNEAFGDSFDFVAEKTKLVKDTLDRLIETGNKDSLIFTELNNLYNNLTGDDEAGSLNWMTDAFVDLGLEIETANKKFKDWKQDLVNGLSDAIVKGEDLGDVFSNIADQIAAMVIKKEIVQPFVNWGLGEIGLGSAHEGAYVSPRGLIQDLPSYHSGGLPGLDRDETIIKAQTGERVLSRDQNEALLSGQLGGNTNVTLIQAVDSKSFQQMLAENRATVTQLSVEDIMKNGQLRKVLKQYL